MASSLLREAVYSPLKGSMRGAGWSSELANVLSIFATFLASGVMHELIIFNVIGHMNGLSLEWLSFFALHGLLLNIELYLKRIWSTHGLPRLPSLISVPMTVCVLFLSAEFLFFPPILRHGLDQLALDEFRDMLPFEKPFLAHIWIAKNLSQAS